MLLPNQLTVLRIILTPVFIFFFVLDSETGKLISLAIFFIAAITDWYDGWLARKFNYITSWGKFWDPLADKILTAGAFFALVYAGVLELWMVSLVIVRDFFITLLRNFADKKGITFNTSKYAKWKTFIQMAFLYYVLVFYVLSTIASLRNSYPDLFKVTLNSELIYYCMLFITILTIHSGYTYLSSNWKLLKGLTK